MAKHPSWATKYKGKKTELRLLNGRYYLYEVSSRWDPEKKRAKKITGKLLGRITKEKGFIESDKNKLRKRAIKLSKISIKEYGMVSFLKSHLGEYKELLKKHFPEQWETILVLVFNRLTEQSSMKNMEYHYLQSYISFEYPNLTLSPSSLTTTLRDIGVQRETITNFFQEFKHDNDNIIFDGTDLLTKSKNMSLPELSKSKQGVFTNLANIMFVFSVTLKLPIYYRIMSGDIKDIKAFSLCLRESKISNAVVIVDKGFYSKGNIKNLKEEKLRYIIPLRRNNKDINYEPIISGDKQNLVGFFKFEKRIIWYYFSNTEEKERVVYIDEELKTREIKDYLNRIEKLPEKYDIETFHKRQYQFGTITLLHNTNKTPNELFVDYKSRNQIENMIDIMKNSLSSDKSYMQNEYALEAWMFINFIAIHWYYKIYQLLVKNKLNSRYSPLDIIKFLLKIRKIKINNQWITEEITKKTKLLLDKLEINIT